MLVAKIASAKDLSVNTISRLSNGGRAKLATVQALAEALHVDPAELLEEVSMVCHSDFWHCQGKNDALLAF